MTCGVKYFLKIIVWIDWREIGQARRGRYENFVLQKIVNFMATLKNLVMSFPQDVWHFFNC